MRLIHITDPHLSDLSCVPARLIRGKRRLGYLSWRRRRHRHLRRHLDALSAEVQGLQPDLILVTGDLVHLGLPEEAAEAAAWLRDLGPPERVLLTPGNHDLYAEDSWAACHAHYAEYLHCRDAGPASATTSEPAFWQGFPSWLRFEALDVYGLSTALPTGFGMASGEVGVAQRQRLQGLMAEAGRDRLRLLALHHPPTSGVMSRRRGLRDAEALAGLMPQMHLILHGHGHWNRHYRCGPAHVLATGSASTENAAFRRLDLARGPDCITVRMRLHQQDGGQFRVIAREEIICATG